MSDIESASSQEWLELWSWFFARGYWSAEVTNMLIHFKWVWSGMPKVIENSKLAISQKWTKEWIWVFACG